jgi:IstB-like ATP binding protein
LATAEAGRSSAIDHSCETATLLRVSVPPPDLSRLNRLLGVGAAAERPEDGAERGSESMIKTWGCVTFSCPSARRRPTPPPLSPWNGAIVMGDPVTELVKAHLKPLRLPAMAWELERLWREAAASNQNMEQFLLRLAEAELAARSANTLEHRIRRAAFPLAKDLDTSDFDARPTLSKPKVLELAFCEWVNQKFNCCFIGNPGTGKTHLATGLGLAACRRGLRVRFFMAAALVSNLEPA